MKSKLYEEIMAAMREGTNTEDIMSLLKNAETQIKKEEEAKISLNELRAAYVEAAYNYYKALGLVSTKEEVENGAKVIEKMTKSNFFTSFFASENNKQPNLEYLINTLI